MEFVQYLLAFVVLLLIWKKPQKESLAFLLLWVCLVADIILWILASAESFVPGFTL